MIIQRFHISYNFCIVLDDNISQIGIELACRKPMYKGHGENKNGKSNLFIGQLVWISSDYLCLAYTRMVLYM